MPSLPCCSGTSLSSACLLQFHGGNRHIGMTPSATTRDRTIPLGLVGGGPAWDAGYRAAVLALTRGRVAAVFAPQPSDAEPLATETGGQLFHSLRRMIDRSGIRALLVFESGWTLDWAMELALSRHLPVFAACPIDEALPRIAPSLTAGEAEGAVIVPGSRLRATPSTLRLRELVATKLGPIQALQVELMVTRSRVDSRAVELIDWCRSLLNSPVHQIHRKARDAGETLVMSCGRRSASTSLVRAEIRLLDSATREGEPKHTVPRFPHVHIECQHGQVELLSETHIRWSTSTESGDEALDGDRPAEQVLLDLFLRRVVGGVVPVPSWAELDEACRLWESVNPK